MTPTPHIPLLTSDHSQSPDNPFLNAIQSVGNPRQIAIKFVALLALLAFGGVVGAYGVRFGEHAILLLAAPLIIPLGVLLFIQPRLLFYLLIASRCALDPILESARFSSSFGLGALLNGFFYRTSGTMGRKVSSYGLMLIGLLLATLAPVGHGAMLNGLSGQLLILNQVVHLACVGAWLGGLLLLVLILRQPQRHGLEPILRRFSGAGYGLVAGLLVTGLINVRVLTGQLWPTPLFQGFALILLIKVLLVLAMLGLALFNRLRIDQCQQRLGVLRASVQLEWLLGLGAVAAVALLGTLPPMIAG